MCEGGYQDGGGCCCWYSAVRGNEYAEGLRYQIVSFIVVDFDGGVSCLMGSGSRATVKNLSICVTSQMELLSRDNQPQKDIGIRRFWYGFLNGCGVNVHMRALLSGEHFRMWNDGGGEQKACMVLLLGENQKIVGNQRFRMSGSI